MDVTLIEYLKQVPVLKGLSNTVLKQLTVNAKLHTLAKEDTLLREGDPSDALFVIFQGWVKVVRPGPEGQEITLNQLGPGQIIGEAAMMDRAPRSATIIAMSGVQVLEIQYDIFLLTMEQHPRLMMSFIADMFDRLRFANLYIQKAIEWSQKVAEGNYEAVENQIQTTKATIIDPNQAQDVRVGAFLSALFNMVAGVKAREEKLKEQLQMIPTIEIDQSKREQDVKKLAKRSFFMRVQNTAEEMRERRKRRKTED